MLIQALPFMQTAKNECYASVQNQPPVSFSVGGPSLATKFDGIIVAGSTYVSLPLRGPAPYYVKVGIWDSITHGVTYTATSTVGASNAVVTYVPIFTGVLYPTLLVRYPTGISPSDGR